MTLDVLFRIALAFVPVILFLASLVYLDSYKLVRLRTIIQLLVCGAAAALLSYFINRSLLLQAVVSEQVLRSVIAPVVEEVLKAVPLLLFMYARRIGFLVDAAIYGFAIGTGFALVENVYYLWAIEDASLVLWLVRGFGTAVMHGGTTAIAAILTKLLLQRSEGRAWWAFLPGLGVAFVIHSLFNHFLLSPLISAVAVIVILPPLLVLVFAESEKYLQSWLGSGFDLASDLLQAIRSGAFSASRPGEYLQTLREHFEGPVVADMLCYLRLHSELSLRAKGILMLRENGLPVKKDADIDAKLEELRFLRKSIGRTGERALTPILQTSSHDLWQLHLLTSE
ncbi:MAG TPA: PrsW family glutamic-type intramembrane protease [Thermoanaerobaculia bacterium]|nr:PrsW family glutamic-type intramembrane protease [Thermoanaerobaculia bacterium]